MGEKSKGNEEPGRIVNRRIGANKGSVMPKMN